MSVAYTIKETRAGSASARAQFQQGGRRVVVTSVTQEFLVQASGVNGALLSEIQVARATEASNSLPIVGVNTYYSPTTGLSMPLCLCMSKEIRRDTKNNLLFHVTCQYQTPPLDEEQQAESPPVSIADLPVTVNRSVSGKDRVLYTDLDDVPCWTLPVVKVPYESPVVTQDAELVFTVEQFEASLTNDQMMDRSFVTNTSSHWGFGANSLLCRCVSAQEQKVQLASGVQSLQKVVYEVRYREGKYITRSGTVAYAGHDAMQPLVSPKKLITDDDGDDKVVRVVDELTGEAIHTHIGTDGREVSDADTNDKPDYLVHKRYESVSFSFLPSSL